MRAVRGLLVLGGLLGAATGRAAEPVRLTDDFAADSLGNYRLSGQVVWQKGCLRLRPRAVRGGREGSACSSLRTGPGRRSVRLRSGRAQATARQCGGVFHPDADSEDLLFRRLRQQRPRHNQEEKKQGY